MGSPYVRQKRSASPDRVLLQYREPTLFFSKLLNEMHVDVEIAAHPFSDNCVEYFKLVRNTVDGVANSYVISRDNCRRYEEMLLPLNLQKIEAEG